MTTDEDIPYTKLDKAIERVLDTMTSVEPVTKEFATMVDQLTKLYKMREIEHIVSQKEAELDLKRREFEKPDRVDLNTWLTVGGHILGIVIIVGYERVNVMTSKALAFVMRLK